jgi:thioredoxin 1
MEANLKTEEDFKNQVLDSPIPVIVDYGAEFCGPCKILAPILHELLEGKADKIKLVTVDISECEDELTTGHEIEDIPVLLLFFKGEEKSRSVHPKREDVEAMIETALKL